ncbi:penicillin-binding protein 2 (plasmid) [Leptolyngbya sp. NIES-3755]|nr:penicillin-binding protein 2 [Leptolyngbya sp. NIES-3755]
MTRFQLSSVRRFRFAAPSVKKGIAKRKKAFILMLLTALLLLGGLGGRLFYLQVIQGKYYFQLAEQNRIRLISTSEERGKILDRKGRILAGSKLSYSVVLQPIAHQPAEWNSILSRLSKILGISTANLENYLKQSGYRSRQPIVVKRGINVAEVTRIKEQLSGFQGVEVRPALMRDYPHKTLAAHVLGYVGEIDAETMRSRQGQDYHFGDLVGKAGIEAVYESQLRGQQGGQQVEINGLGQIVRKLADKPAQPGQDVQLTIDLDLQKAAEDALGDRTGAIVALNPSNGEVLAMASRPGFDPNLFVKQISSQAWQQLQAKQFPFLNRALQAYPPASTFKIVTTTAALESGKYTPNTVLGTYPYLSTGGGQIWESNRAGFGQVGFVDALAWSSNTFFAQVAIGTEAKPLLDWAKRFGFGETTGIEVSNEEAHGLVPDPDWKQKQLKEGWYVGDTINTAIGQGMLQATPLQIAVMFSAVGNGGYRVKPSLVKKSQVIPVQNQGNALNLKPETLRVLQAGLRSVVSKGTGQALNESTLPSVSGKSGTAEDPPRPNHAWFGAYAPSDNPKIVVVAFAENSGGGGGAIAAPMIRQVMDVYFKTKQPN